MDISFGGADLIFPHLGIIIQHLGRSFTLFGSFNIAFYGIIIGIGMVLALFCAAKNASYHGEDPNIVYDFFIYVVICGLIGARLYYVIFRWADYAGNPWRILNIREGGLAIYGAVIGGILAGVIYCRVRRYPLLKLMDISLPGVILAQGIGRWGNFFNCEAFGEYTDSIFAMRIKLSLVNSSMLSQSHMDHIIHDAGYDYIQAHPTFLYESVWDIVSFVILIFMCRKYDVGIGRVSIGYFFLYGAGRFFIEGLRTDQLLIPGSTIPVSQLVSFLLVIGSLIWLALSRRKTRIS